MSIFAAMDEDYSAGSADADREMTRLWRTWRTVFEMLQDRVCDPDGEGWECGQEMWLTSVGTTGLRSH